MAGVRFEGVNSVTRMQREKRRGQVKRRKPFHGAADRFHRELRVLHGAGISAADINVVLHIITLFDGTLIDVKAA